tara:strand:- start:2196 stop:3233 length:1038 start_codon:yes stop_codon:yes gene_type:complete
MAIKERLVMENDGSLTTATESLVGLLQQSEGGLTSLNDDTKPGAQVVQQNDQDQNEIVTEEPLQEPIESVSADDESEVQDQDVEDHATDELTEEPQLTPQEEIFEVKVQGDTYEVDRNELIAGYQRQQDYTRKTESLAIEKQQANEDFIRQQDVVKTRISEAEKLTDLARKQLGLDAQGLDDLILNDPVEGTRRKHELEMRARQLGAQQQQLNAVRQEEMVKYQKEEERKVRLEIPEMADPEKRPQFVNNMRTYLDKMGFNNDEINGVGDSRYFKLIRDGMKWNNLQKQKLPLSKKVANAPKVVKGGVVNSKSSRNAQAQNDRMAKLKKSGSLEDATEMFKDLFK